MFEALLAPNTSLILQNIGFFASSFVVAELYEKLNIKAVLTFQRKVSHIRKNTAKASMEMRKDGASGAVLNFGKKIVHLHHSRTGAILIGASVLFANLSLFVFSVGLIVHHFVRDAIRDKKLSFI